jgi:PilZ domain
MDDRRASTRNAVHIAGKLLSPDLLCSVEVVIKDLSETGALVSAVDRAAFPDRGYLWEAKTGTLFECSVQWRKNDKLFGLRFTDASARTRLRALIAASGAEAQDRQRNVARRVLLAKAA